MTRDQAREILSMRRPSGADDHDPLIADALEFARCDQELGRWLAQQTAFDAGVTRACAEIPVPMNLRARLLAADKVVVLPWWRRSLHPAEMAAAACIALLLALGAVWLGTREPGTASLRERVIEETWSGRRHVALETTNLAEIRRFIAAHELRGDFKLPPQLSAMRARGCSIVHVDGKRLPFVCFVDNNRHLHLAVLERGTLPDVAGTAMPDFDKWQGWATATWTRGSNTFVLTGMKPVDFVRKFRKAGQWTWDGGS
jgi:hypothetical protein